MYMDTYDRIIRLPTFSIRLTHIPRDILLRIILCLIPLPALQWIRHNSHYDHRIRTPMLHEIFGTGHLPIYIDMTRYRLWMERPYWQRVPLLSDIARSRNHLHDTISRIHLSLLNIVYWAPTSLMPRINMIHTIMKCREHEEHWAQLRPHYPLRTYRFTSKFIITDELDNRILATIEWSWHISDATIWHPGTNYLLAYPPYVHGELDHDYFVDDDGELDPEYFMTTRLIERDDPSGVPWHPGYYMNGTPSSIANDRPPACAFSIPMSARHTQQLTQALHHLRHTNYKMHFDILNNDYCLTSHLLAGETMTVPVNTPQQIMTQQQHQHQHNLTNIMHTRHARHGYTTTDTATHTHTSDVFFSFRTHGDRRLQRTLMQYLSQIPENDGDMLGFDLTLQQRLPALEHTVNDQLVHLNPVPHQPPVN